MRRLFGVYALLSFLCVAIMFSSCGNKTRSQVIDETEDTASVSYPAQDSIVGHKLDTIVGKAAIATVPAKDANDETLAPSDDADTIDVTSEESTGAVFTPTHSVSGTKLICLTFDDGPSNKTTPKVLDVMQQYNAHCTFFCIGSNITESTKQNLARAESLGCEVANHTFTHPSLTKCSKEKQIEELNKTNEKIRDAVGHYPTFFRPPYLAINNSVLQGLNLVCISGSSSDDWITSKTPARIVEDVMKLAKDGAIIVMHDLGANHRTPVALETLVPRLQAEGFTLVTVSELFSARGKQPELQKIYTSVKQ